MLPVSHRERLFSRDAVAAAACLEDCDHVVQAKHISREPYITIPSDEQGDEVSDGESLANKVSNTLPGPEVNVVLTRAVRIK